MRLGATGPVSTRRRRRHAAAWLTVALLLSALCWHCPLAAAPAAPVPAAAHAHCDDDGRPSPATLPDCEHCQGGATLLPPGAPAFHESGHDLPPALPPRTILAWSLPGRPAHRGRAPPPHTPADTPLARAERLLV